MSRVAYTASATDVPQTDAMPPTVMPELAYLAAETTPQPPVMMMPVPTASAMQRCTSVGGWLGDREALDVLGQVKADLGVGIVTDIHLPEEAAMAAEVADVLQIPAFLCRQTDLLVAAAQTGRTVNVKKGQFMAPSSMKHAVDKIRESGNDQVWLTERGTMHGYGDLVVDMRGLTEMRAFAPVFMDLTHSLQQPNQASGVTGGRPELIATVARAAVAAGLDGVFIETHPDPSKALSDGANMLPLNQLEGLLTTLASLHEWRQTHA